MSIFAAKISGNPVNISLILNAIDVVNANRLYPRVCLDGYHFEDVGIVVSIGEVNDMNLIAVQASNVRGSL